MPFPYRDNFVRPILPAQHVFPAARQLLHRHGLDVVLGREIVSRVEQYTRPPSPPPPDGDDGGGVPQPRLLVVLCKKKDDRINGCHDHISNYKHRDGLPFVRMVHPTTLLELLTTLLCNRVGRPRRHDDQGCCCPFEVREGYDGMPPTICLLILLSNDPACFFVSSPPLQVAGGRG